MSDATLTPPNPLPIGDGLALCLHPNATQAVRLHPTVPGGWQIYQACPDCPQRASHWKPLYEVPPMTPWLLFVGPEEER